MTQQSRLLSLPPELRYQIWFHALCPSRLRLASEESHAAADSKPIVYLTLVRRRFCSDQDRQAQFWGTTLSSSVFLLNRQIRDEAEEVLWTKFLIVFPHCIVPHHSGEFLQKLSRGALAKMRHIGLNITVGVTSSRKCSVGDKVVKRWIRSFEKLLTQLPGMKTVRIEVHVVGWPDPAQTAEVITKLGEVFESKKLTLVNGHHTNPQGAKIVAKCRKLLGHPSE